MARRLLLAIVTSSIVLGLISFAGAQSDDESGIFDLVNRERSRSRLGDLEWNDDLAESPATSRDKWHEKTSSAIPTRRAEL